MSLMTGLTSIRWESCGERVWFRLGQRMNEVGAIVEGQTEEAFVREILSPHLVSHGVDMWARLPGRFVRHGGTRPWKSICSEIIRTLRERDSRTCTMMFDYYALPSDWPGRKTAQELSWKYRAEHIEAALLNDLAEHMGSEFHRDRFIPYVQLHEFEAVLFSDVRKFAEVLHQAKCVGPSKPERELEAILAVAGSPEAINDGPNTAPSRRVIALASGYRKPIHGLIAAKRIGLPQMRSSCEHFDKWVSRLETVGAQ